MSEVDESKAKRTVDVALSESVTVSVGVDGVLIHDQGNRSQIEEAVVSTLLAVLQLRDIARKESGRLSISPNFHTAEPHTLHADCPLDCLNLSPRPYNCLVNEFRNNGKELTVGNLLALHERDLRYIHHLGKVGIGEIKAKVADAGYRLG